MVKKVLSLLMVGTLACSMLAGCGSGTEELPKEGTGVEVQENQNTENNGTAENIQPSEDGNDGAVTALPEGTYVRVVRDGFIKESQNGDGTSHYKIVYGNEAATGTQNDLLLEFSSIQNIGSWEDENADSGVWRYIDDTTWMTTAIWGGGLVPSVDNSPLTIDNTNIEDIKAMLQGITVYEDTVEARTADNYSAITVRVDRVDAGLSGYVTILDDKESSLRWIIQFLMLSDSADLDMLKETAKSVAIGKGFNRETLEEESKISDKPFVANDNMAPIGEGAPEGNMDEAAENTNENTNENSDAQVENAETTEEVEDTEATN